MGRVKEIVVVNLLDDAVWRGGYVFHPKSERRVEVTKTKYAEIEACGALQIYTNGLMCDHPGCGFVAKSERGLQTHKRYHRKEGAVNG